MATVSRPASTSVVLPAHKAALRLGVTALPALAAYYFIGITAAP